MGPKPGSAADQANRLNFYSGEWSQYLFRGITKTGDQE